MSQVNRPDVMASGVKMSHSGFVDLITLVSSHSHARNQGSIYAVSNKNGVFDRTDNLSISCT